MSDHDYAATTVEVVNVGRAELTEILDAPTDGVHTITWNLNLNDALSAIKLPYVTDVTEGTHKTDGSAHLYTLSNGTTSLELKLIKTSESGDVRLVGIDPSAYKLVNKLGSSHEDAMEQFVKCLDISTSGVLVVLTLDEQINANTNCTLVPVLIYALSGAVVNSLKPQVIDGSLMVDAGEYVVVANSESIDLTKIFTSTLYENTFTYTTADQVSIPLDGLTVKSVFNGAQMTPSTEYAFLSDSNSPAIDRTLYGAVSSTSDQFTYTPPHFILNDQVRKVRHSYNGSEMLVGESYQLDFDNGLDYTLYSWAPVTVGSYFSYSGQSNTIALAGMKVSQAVNGEISQLGSSMIPGCTYKILSVASPTFLMNFGAADNPIANQTFVFNYLDLTSVNVYNTSGSATLGSTMVVGNPYTVITNTATPPVDISTIGGATADAVEFVYEANQIDFSLSGLSVYQATDNTKAINTFMAALKVSGGSYDWYLRNDKNTQSVTTQVRDGLAKLFDKTPELNNLLGSSASSTVFIDPTKVQSKLSDPLHQMYSKFFSVEQLREILEAVSDRNIKVSGLNSTRKIAFTSGDSITAIVKINDSDGGDVYNSDRWLITLVHSVSAPPE